jgi:nucleotide-binding universal stress UspA family protein
MDYRAGDYRSALQDFRAARQQAALQDVLARLTGRSTRLLSYDEVAHLLKLGPRSDRGIRQIPIEAIVGSVGRYTDFTRTFLPRQDADQQRWARVKAATGGSQGAGIPPIDVYKVGEVYFVLDGNHRVSIARQQGISHIDANVIDVQTAVPLTPDIQPDDLIVKAEHAEFLSQTRLAELRPDSVLVLTSPGAYRLLSKQIEGHHYLMAQEQGREVLYEEAVTTWYDEIYLPVVTEIRERGLLHWFPKRTEADLYLWASEHRQALEEDLGWAVRPEAAVTDLAIHQSSRAEHQEQAVGAWRTARMVNRYTEHLFHDILLPLSGTQESWTGLDQALMVAAREDAQVICLHLVEEQKERASARVEAIRSRFLETCERAGVRGGFVIEQGDIGDRIVERALLTDLVVLQTAHPPAPGLPGLGSGLRAILHRISRPVLAVPCCKPSPLDKALLAFDGSPKAKEALFVAAYLAEQWMTELTVMAVAGRERLTPGVLDFARRYLELHEIQADFLLVEGPIDMLHDAMDERDINLLIMGGYSLSVMEEVMKGSAVNIMLRERHSPIFLCR